MDIQPDTLARRFLFVFAHPDDESFYSGGLISRIINHDGNAKILSFTDGNKGHIHGSLNKRTSLGNIRSQELKEAAAQLGVQNICIGDFPDGGLDQIPRTELVDFLLREIQTFEPDIVVTFGDEPFYNHRDHLETEQAVAGAIRIVNLHSSKQINLWKRGYSADQLHSYYALRNLHRKRTPSSRQKHTELASHQKGLIQLTLTPAEIQKRELAILCHQTQKPEIFAAHLRLTENRAEYYGVLNL